MSAIGAQEREVEPREKQGDRQEQKELKQMTWSAKIFVLERLRARGS